MFTSFRLEFVKAPQADDFSYAYVNSIFRKQRLNVHLSFEWTCVCSLRNIVRRVTKNNWMEIVTYENYTTYSMDIILFA